MWFIALLSFKVVDVPSIAKEGMMVQAHSLTHLWKLDIVHVFVQLLKSNSFLRCQEARQSADAAK